MTYEPWKLREDAARYDRMGERLDTDLMRAHAAALEENKRLAAKVAELETALLGIKQYREKNPLGGPAKVFDAMADQIRAGDDFNKVIADYGWCPVSRAERAEAALAESERKCERLSAQMKQMENERREDLRSAAAEASRAERFPDEPYGTY